MANSKIYRDLMFFFPAIMDDCPLVIEQVAKLASMQSEFLDVSTGVLVDFYASRSLEPPLRGLPSGNLT